MLVAQLCPTLCDPMDSSPAVACQVPPLSVEFSREEYWSGLPFPPPVTKQRCIQTAVSLKDTYACMFLWTSLPSSLSSPSKWYQYIYSPGRSAANGSFTKAQSGYFFLKYFLNRARNFFCFLSTPASILSKAHIVIISHLPSLWSTPIISHAFSLPYLVLIYVLYVP